MTHASPHRPKVRRLVQAGMAFLILAAFSFILVSKVTGIFSSFRDEAFWVLLANTVGLILTIVLEGHAILRAAARLLKDFAVAGRLGSRALEKLARTFEEIHIFLSGSKADRAHQDADSPSNTVLTRDKAEGKDITLNGVQAKNRAVRQRRKRARHP